MANLRPVNVSIRASDVPTFERVLGLVPDWMDVSPFDRDGLFRRLVSDPNLDLEGALVAWLGDEPVGFVLAVGRRVPLENAPDDSHRGYLTLLAVHPSHRREGVGRALVRAAEAFHVAQGRKEVWVSPYAPAYLWPGPELTRHADGVACLTAEGYQEVYRPISMEIDLRLAEEPEFVREARQRLASEGVGFAPLGAGCYLRTLEFAQRVFKGDWVRVVRETGSAILSGEASPSRLIVATADDGRVLGFSHYEGPRFGPIGVCPGQRGRKIGQVLMWETLHAQRSAGHATAWFLWSDDATANRLYDGAGFRTVRRFVLLKKTL